MGLDSYFPHGSLPAATDFLPTQTRRGETNEASRTNPASSSGPARGGAKPDLEYVAAPGHGSGCGCCTGKAQWVPKEQAEKARKDQKQKVLAEVWAHERAHQSAGKHLAGAPVVREHADGGADGEVPVTIPKINQDNPDTTIADGDTIAASAMAPDKPSAQDYKVLQTGLGLKAEAQSYKSSDTFKQRHPDKAGVPL